MPHNIIFDIICAPEIWYFSLILWVLLNFQFFPCNLQVLNLKQLLQERHFFLSSSSITIKILFNFVLYDLKKKTKNFTIVRWLVKLKSFLTFIFKQFFLHCCSIFDNSSAITNKIKNPFYFREWSRTLKRTNSQNLTPLVQFHFFNYII